MTHDEWEQRRRELQKHVAEAAAEIEKLERGVSHWRIFGFSMTFAGIVYGLISYVSLALGIALAVFGLSQLIYSLPQDERWQKRLIRQALAERDRLQATYDYHLRKDIDTQ